jgi:hypothetical protein
VLVAFTLVAFTLVAFALVAFALVAFALVAFTLVALVRAGGVCLCCGIRTSGIYAVVVTAAHLSYSTSCNQILCT